MHLPNPHTPSDTGEPSHDFFVPAKLLDAPGVLEDFLAREKENKKWNQGVMSGNIIPLDTQIFRGAEEIGKKTISESLQKTRRATFEVLESLPGRSCNQKPDFQLRLEVLLTENSAEFVNCSLDELLQIFDRMRSDMRDSGTTTADKKLRRSLLRQYATQEKNIRQFVEIRNTVKVLEAQIIRYRNHLQTNTHISELVDHLNQGVLVEFSGKLQQISLEFTKVDSSMQQHGAYNRIKKRLSICHRAYAIVESNLMRLGRQITSMDFSNFVEKHLQGHAFLQVFHIPLTGDIKKNPQMKKKMQTVKRYVKLLSTLREEYLNIWLAAFAHSTDPFMVLSDECIQKISQEPQESIFNTIATLSVFDRKLEGLIQLIHSYIEYQENVTIDSQEALPDSTEQKIDYISTSNIEFVQRSIQLVIDIYRAVLTVHT